MLQIRNEQLEAMSQTLLESFVERVSLDLLERFPPECEVVGLREETRKAFVRQGMAEAEKHGIVYEYDIERYLTCMVMLNPKFDRDPKFEWAGTILRRRDLDGEGKMDAIWDHLTFAREGPPE